MMATVHATTTQTITGIEYGVQSATSHRHRERKITVRAGAAISFDPDKYVWKSQPIVLRNGRTVWVNMAELHRSIDIDAAEVRRQHAGRARAKGTVASRWADVHAAEAAGRPIRHPREYVFGK